MSKYIKNINCLGLGTYYTKRCKVLVGNIEDLAILFKFAFGTLNDVESNLARLHVSSWATTKLTHSCRMIQFRATAPFLVYQVFT